jgi:hypothetical protein
MKSLIHSRRQPLASLKFVDITRYRYRGKELEILKGTCALLGCYAADSDNSLPLFGTIYQFHLRRPINVRWFLDWLDFFTLEVETARFLEFLALLGPGCPETSESNYNCTLRNTLEERRSLLLRGGNKKSREILGNRKLLLKFIIRKCNERVWTGLKRIRTGAGGEFLDWLSEYQISQVSYTLCVIV